MALWASSQNSSERAEYGEWESAQVLPKEYCHWASAQNSSERAEEANGSLPRFSRKSIAILRLLKTGEQHRRMGVFGKSIGIMGEFSKLFRESRRGEWESSKVFTKSIAILRLLKTGEQHRRMGVFGKSIGIMGEFSKLFRVSRRGEWEFSQVLAKEYCHSATSQNWRAA